MSVCPTCGHRTAGPKNTIAPESGIVPMLSHRKLFASWCDYLDGRERAGQPRYPRYKVTGSAREVVRWTRSKSVAPWYWRLVALFYAGRLSIEQIDVGSWTLATPSGTFTVAHDELADWLDGHVLTPLEVAA